MISVGLLLQIRSAMKQKMPTVLSRACEFLHTDLVPAFYWWEVVVLAERIVLSGTLLLIPNAQDCA